MSIARWLCPLFAAALCAQEPKWPAPAEGDFVARDFRFASGEVMPELRLHYRTIGKLVRDERGHAKNAVLILHGTTGSGANFLRAEFAGELFGRGGLLDAERFFIVLPDAIGHGGSSKPSDGQRMKFPHYNYDDMVALQYRLLTEHLGVNHLRLIMGTSMGCMHAWVWGYTYPAFADGLAPMACVPPRIAGRNRMMRRMIIDAIKNDPDYKGGDYTTQPKAVQVANVFFGIATNGGTLAYQKTAPTREAADKLLANPVIESYRIEIDAGARPAGAGR